VQGIELLEAIVLVLYPAFSAAYTARLATCNEAADPPLARVLRRVQHDLAVVTTEGEELLAELVATNEVGPPAGAGSAARAASPPSSGPAARPGSAAWRIGETLGAAAAPFGVPSC
jgi:hypothetical protein